MPIKYGDFSSLVQLGVGLHLGAAILQLFPEFAAAPLQRAVARIKQGAAEVSVGDDMTEECNKLEGDYQLFQIGLFHKTKHLVKSNFAVALILIGILTAISYKAQDDLNESLSVLIAFLSVVPAFLTLAVLWWNTRDDLSNLKKRANELEKRVFRTR
jgi:hypothetical protein